jgi:hypothetical protein
MSSALAFMGNQQNIEAEYKDRYVWRDSAGPDRKISLREPLVRVVPNGLNYDIVRNPESDYAKATRGKRNRCPGPDALEPLDEEIAASDRLQAAMKSVIADYDSKIIDLLDRHYSMIDVLTAFGAAIARCLMDSGFATFDEKDVARNLGSPDAATSTGAYILNRAENNLDTTKITGLLLSIPP